MFAGFLSSAGMSTFFVAPPPPPPPESPPPHACRTAPMTTLSTTTASSQGRPPGFDAPFTVNSPPRCSPPGNSPEAPGHPTPPDREPHHVRGLASTAGLAPPPAASQIG